VNQKYPDAHLVQIPFFTRRLMQDCVDLDLKKNATNVLSFILLCQAEEAARNLVRVAIGDSNSS